MITVLKRPLPQRVAALLAAALAAAALAAALAHSSQVPGGSGVASNGVIFGFGVLANNGVIHPDGGQSFEAAR